MSSGRWSELSAKHKVTYTGDVRVLVDSMSKASGVAKGLYGLVFGVSGPKIRRDLLSLFRTARGWAALVGRDDMDVRS
jgi:hypothetical protein